MYERIRRDTLNDFPEVIQNINDFKAMSASNNIQNELLADDMEQFERDLYFDTMQEDVVKMHEKFFDIHSLDGETLQFRRERIKSRYNIKPPFTRNYMKEKLDLIIGEEKYNLTVNCMNKSITVEASMEDKPYFEELYVTFNLIKPCTMVFITKPYTVCGIKISDAISRRTVQFYKMDGSKKLDGWKLGNVGDSMEVMTMTNTTNLVQEEKRNIKEKVAKILINDTLVITNFAKIITNGGVEISYYVDSSVTEVTNIKILKSDNTVLTESTVYVPNQVNMEFKQVIKVQEGV